TARGGGGGWGGVGPPPAARGGGGMVGRGGARAGGVGAAGWGAAPPLARVLRRAAPAPAVGLYANPGLSSSSRTAERPEHQVRQGRGSSHRAAGGRRTAEPFAAGDARQLTGTAHASRRAHLSSGR